MKYNLEIEISNIQIDDKYYSFEYKAILDGKLKKKGEYSNDHSWHNNIEYFKGILKDHFALQITLEHIF